MYYIPSDFYGGVIYTEDGFKSRLNHITSTLEYYIKTHAGTGNECLYGYELQKIKNRRYFSEVMYDIEYKNSDLIFISEYIN